MRNLYVVTQALLVGLILMLSPTSAAAETCDGLDNDGDGFFDESTVVVAGNCGQAIPDHSAAGNGSPASCFVTVAETRTVLDANVQLSITHTYAADLEVDLVTNSGGELRMFADVGGPGNNFTGTVLDDDAGSPIASGSAPFAGSYQPQSSLDACIDGTDPSGVWTLRVWDDLSSDTGTIDSFSMEFDVANDLDGDGWGAGCECNDSDITIFPGAVEIPDDNVDQDCNGFDTVTCFFDGDLDGFGSATNILSIDGDCDDPGESPNSGDCDDLVSTVNPSAIELCNGVDDDCNGSADFDLAGEVDADGDGELSCSDCDDTDPANSYAGSEICDGQDNNCNGLADFDAAGEVDADFDGDLSCNDCDDTDPMTWTGAPELCDGVDNDCDGLANLDAAGEVDSDGDSDLSCVDCDDTDAALNFNDVDGDGYTSCAADSCLTFVMNDSYGDGWNGGHLSVSVEGVWVTDLSVSNASGYTETQIVCAAPGNSIDLVYIAGNWESENTYEVLDDGGVVVFWDGPSPTPGLVWSSTFPSVETDCDDNDAAVHPGAAELCNGIDDDCNGLADFDAAGEVDADGDGDLSCSDCDDADGANFTGNIEVCDGFDNDCNGLADFITLLGDDDDDSAGDDDDSAGDDDDSAGDDDDSAGDDDDSAARGGDDDDSAGEDDDSAGPGFESEELDIDGDGYLECADDCDDFSVDFAPDAPELCDGWDNDCDGVLPDDEADADADGQMECEGDCDDADPTTSLGTKEICDGLDNDCDGSVADEELDTDSDGFSPCEGDCDDTNPDASPASAEDTAEACSDGFDNDCDDLVDLDDDECDDFVGDDDDAAGDDDDSSGAGSLGCNCSVLTDRDGLEGAALLLLGLLAVIWRRREQETLAD